MLSLSPSKQPSLRPSLVFFQAAFVLCFWFDSTVFLYPVFINTNIKIFVTLASFFTTVFCPIRHSFSQAICGRRFIYLQVFHCCIDSLKSLPQWKCFYTWVPHIHTMQSLLCFDTGAILFGIGRSQVCFPLAFPPIHHRLYLRDFQRKCTLWFCIRLTLQFISSKHSHYLYEVCILLIEAFNKAQQKSKPFTLCFSF